MRKFVDKNRQKRKYIKQQTAVFSSPEFTLLGLIPAIVIAITVILTIIRNPIEFDINYSPIFQMPKAGWTLKDISQLVLHIFHFIFGVVSLFFVTVANAFSQTNSEITQSFAQGLNTVINILNQTNNGVAQSFTQSVNAIGYVIHLVFHYILTTTVALLDVMIDSFTAIFSFIDEIIKGVVSVITEIFIKIGSLISQIAKMIKAPFILLGNYLEKTKPFFNYIVASLRPAIADLNTGLTDIFNILGHLSKSSS